MTEEVKKPNGNGMRATKKGVLKILEARSARVGELARTLNKSRATIVQAISALKQDGRVILLEPSNQTYYIRHELRSNFTPVPRSVLYTNQVIKSLGISETHIGGRHSQPHFVPLSAAFIHNKRFGKIDVVTHYGDVCNGVKHLDYSRGENTLNTVDLQIDAAVEVLDCFKGLPVFIKPGDHDMWQFSAVGFDMVRSIIRTLNFMRKVDKKEPNFNYVGSDNENQTVFQDFVLEFNHITSAQSRGLTTKAQYMFEDRIGDFVKHRRAQQSKRKSGAAQPDHIGCGNWHREISFFHGGTAIDLYPGFQALTTWERGMGIVHKFGAKIVTLGKDSFGNVFRYDVRYLDFSDQIEKITKQDLDKNLTDLALGSFRKHRAKLLGE